MTYYLDSNSGKVAPRFFVNAETYYKWIAGNTRTPTQILNQTSLEREANTLALKGNSLIVFTNSTWYINLVGSKVFGLWSPHCMLVQSIYNCGSYFIQLIGSSGQGTEARYLLNQSLDLQGLLGFYNLGTHIQVSDNAIYPQSKDRVGYTSLDDLLYSGWLNTRPDNPGNWLVSNLVEIGDLNHTCSSYIHYLLTGKRKLRTLPIDLVCNDYRKNLPVS